MKRFFSFVVVLIFLLALPSAYNPQVKGLKEGYIAPEVVLGDSIVYSSNVAGVGYTLIHFWASYDAPSRIANIKYDNALESIGQDKVRYVAVSYERNKALFGEIVRRDRLESANQYYDMAGENSEVYNLYRLNKVFATYLIDASGTIVAENPSLQTLAQILGE